MLHFVFDVQRYTVTLVNIMFGFIACFDKLNMFEIYDTRAPGRIVKKIMMNCQYCALSDTTSQVTVINRIFFRRFVYVCGLVWFILAIINHHCSDLVKYLLMWILIFQNTGAKPKKTMVESLLGEHSNLVNLDNIVQVPLYTFLIFSCRYSQCFW